MQLFRLLVTPPNNTGKAVFAAIRVDPYRCFKLGKDAEDRPNLLIQIDADPDASPPPIRLQHLHITHNLDCEIHRDREVESGVFTVISCVDADAQLEVYFLNIVQALLPTLGSNPTTFEIHQAVDYLVQLFQALKDPPRKTVQGLWAELLVIASSKDANALVEAWHSMPEELYDFSSAAQKLEVKSASGQMRRHHFSLAQLRPLPNATLVIASVIVNRCDTGSTVSDLVAEIEHKLARNKGSILRLHKIVALTLGEAWRQATFQSYDREAATNSLAFFDSDDIPTIEAQLPPGVSDVHFKSDLTGNTPISAERLQRYGGMFSCLCSDARQFTSPSPDYRHPR